MDYPVLLQVLRECDPEDRLGCLTGTGNDAEDIQALTAYVETLAGKSRILYVLRHVVDDEDTSEQTHGMAEVLLSNLGSQMNKLLSEKKRIPCPNITRCIARTPACEYGLETGENCEDEL